MSRTVLRLENVSKIFKRGDEEVTALKNISFEVKEGSFFSITGTSGSGKSTLLHLLGLLDTPTAGKYYLDGEDVSTLDDKARTHVRNQKIGFIFQSFYLLSRYTALENVCMPLLYASSPVSKKQMESIAQERLHAVGLSDRMNHFPNQLSGGQRQRVAIARALVNNPALLLADEPTGNLDSKTGEDILSLFQTLHDGGATILLVTHDQLIASRTQKIISLIDGEIVS